MKTYKKKKEKLSRMNVLKAPKLSEKVNITLVMLPNTKK